MATLRTDSDFERVFSAKNRFFREGLGFHYRIADHSDFRFGLVVPKRFGGAVERNKFRRRVRELIRRNSRLPSGVEIIVYIYKPLKDIGFNLINQTLGWAIDRVRRSSGQIRQSNTGKTSMGVNNV